MGRGARRGFPRADSGDESRVVDANGHADDMAQLHVEAPDPLPDRPHPERRARVAAGRPLLFIFNVRRPHDAVDARELQPIQPPVELRYTRAPSPATSSGSSAKPALSTAGRPDVVV